MENDEDPKPALRQLKLSIPDVCSGGKISPNNLRSYLAPVRLSAC